MKIRKELITPKRAEELLGYNTNNRQLNTHYVSHLALQMKLGKWQENGEAIKLNGKLLLDGQHRLCAVVESNKPQEMLVIDELGDDAFKTIDQGMRRSAGHIMGIAGIANGNMLAAAVGLVTLVKNKGKRIGRWRPPAEIIDFIEKHPGLHNSAQRIGPTPQYLCPRSMFVAMHYLFSMSDAACADKFIDQVLSGEHMTSRAPAMVLRNRIIAEKQHGGIGSMAARTYLVALFIKAWNAFILGNDVGTLKWSGSGDNPEDWPKIK